MNKILIVTVGLALCIQPVLSEEHKKEEAHSHEEGEGHSDKAESGQSEEESEAVNMGADKGVLEASKKKGFKLSPEAASHLGIKTETPKREGNLLSLPKASLASVKREHFIYAEKDGFFKPIEVVLVRRSSDRVFVKAEQKESLPEKVAVQGVHFLRNIEVDIFSGEEGGHHH